MAVRSVPQLVLDEALEVLGELGVWLSLAYSCPKCGVLQDCSHQPGCPLIRVARLRCLLGSGDQQRRDDEFVALRRERGELVTSEGDRPLPASLGSAATLASAAIELPLATPRLLLLMLQQSREGQPWPSLARLDRTSRIHRRSVIRILRELKERGIIDTRPRDFAAGKAGAT